jgi:DNA modification methylase
MTVSRDRAGSKPPFPLQITFKPVEGLRLDSKNPRHHDPGQIKKIARSIEQFGFNVPILIDAEQTVIAGHGRLLASKRLGLNEVPTIQLEHLSPAKRRAFMIADNRLTEVATWNEVLLAQSLKELSLLDLDFDLETIGFDPGEIDLRIAGLESPEEPETSQCFVGSDRPAITQPGDLWVLGKHKIYCGSALEENSYQVLLEDRKAVAVFTDPPYNVPIDGHASGLGATRHGDFAMASGEMDADEFTKFLATACERMASHSSDGSLHFICMDWRHIDELSAAARGIYSELKNLCVWVKNNAGMGSLYRSQHEIIFVYKHGTAHHQNNVQLGRFGRHRSNVWTYPGANTFGRAGEEGKLLAAHPTVKPTAMVADAIMDCSRRGDIVLDPFLGSGTTILAAERTGRRGYGIELDPHYVDVAIRRWQTHTRDCARHARGGQTFDELAAARQ